MLFWADKASFFSSNSQEYAKESPEKLRKKIAFSLEGLPEHIVAEIRGMELPPKVREMLERLKP